jgi:RepB DNA-primase from phage plasmid
MTPAREAANIPAVEYIRTNFHPSDRTAILVRNAGSREALQRIATSERIIAHSFQEWLQHKNDKESCDIYLGMNTLKSEARTRTKEDIQTIRHLYLDIDHEGPAALEKIHQSNLVPEPNYTVNTSPEKFQVVWRVEGISQEQAETLQRAMARKFGGDPAATDSTRVLRLVLSTASTLPSFECERKSTPIASTTFKTSACAPIPLIPTPGAPHLLGNAVDGASLVNPVRT